MSRHDLRDESRTRTIGQGSRSILKAARSYTATVARIDFGQRRQNFIQTNWQENHEGRGRRDVIRTLQALLTTVSSTTRRLPHYVTSYDSSTGIRSGIYQRRIHRTIQEAAVITSVNFPRAGTLTVGKPSGHSWLSGRLSIKLGEVKGEDMFKAKSQMFSLSTPGIKTVDVTGVTRVTESGRDSHRPASARSRQGIWSRGRGLNEWGTDAFTRARRKGKKERDSVMVGLVLY
ncbi:hypothetical protein DFS33DRAFT_1271190 [Desarmillaria ectypa]|nr:hypothetical protein DFS33DRAFT_1271190 [Desarmillaria ectypa]